MPNYDFKCSGCGQEFERNVPLVEYDVPQQCPECQLTLAVREVKNAPGWTGKGGGWTPKFYR